MLIMLNIIIIQLYSNIMLISIYSLFFRTLWKILVTISQIGVFLLEKLGEIVKKVRQKSSEKFQKFLDCYFYI